MAEKNGSSSSQTLTSLNPSTPKVGKGRRRNPKSTVEGEVARDPSRTVISSSKGKERALDPLPPIPSLSAATGKKKEKKYKKKEHKSLNGESSTSGPHSSAKKSHKRKEGDFWDVIPVAQNEISRIPPVWSNDGRFYLTVTHTSIHIHSSTAPSFTRLSTLSSTHRDGHTKPITSLHLSPTSSFQIISSSEDGTIKIWDWVTGRSVRTIKFTDNNAKVHHVAFGEVAGKWCIFAAVTSSKDVAGQKLSHRVLKVPFTGSTTPYVIGKLSAPPTALMMSPRSTYLVVLSATKAYTYRMPSTHADPTVDIWENRPTCVKFVSDQAFTCGAFSPEKTLATSNEEEWFATGDEKGVIRLWHGLAQAFRQVDLAAQSVIGQSSSGAADTERKLPTTSLHWHAHAVSAIAFTPSGSQLLSVGEESVLVQWHLASGKREYIPRLGGRPIISLAIRKASHGSEEEWWMSLADGSTIRVGSASGQISNVGQGIRLDPLRPTSSTKAYPFSLHPSTSALVVPSSHPSTLQFIDPIASSVLFDLEVVPSNRISRRDEKELESVQVEKVTFSDAQDGQSVWMATFESRTGDDLEGGGKVRNLKLWKWQDERYSVNTQFPRAHGLSPLTSVVFSPIQQGSDTSSSESSFAHPCLLTASADGVAKIWQIRQSKVSQQVYWSCRSTFDYRGLPIFDSAFSPDGTIVVLAHGSVVTLWDVESNVLLKVFDTSSGSDVTQIGFVGQEGRYLVGTGQAQGIIVWDLLSCDVAWSVRDQAVQNLVILNDIFVVSSSTSQESAITVYSPISSTPLRQVSTPKVFKQLQILPSALTPTSTSSASLHFVGVDASGEIFRFGDLAHAAAPLSSKKVSTSNGQKQGLSIWQEMFGKDAFLDMGMTIDETEQDSDKATATASALQQSIVRGKGKPADVFSGPSHTMPSTSILFDAFMDELLSGNKAARRDQEDNTQGSDEDDEDGAITYQDDDVVQAEAAVPVLSVKGKEVRDEEIKELEVFFREVLGNVTSHTNPTNTTATTPKTPALVKAKKVNGHLPNGDHASSATANTSTPINSKKPHVNGVHIEADDNMEVDTPASKKGSVGKGKKRKALRED
uniref:WD repeat-containing protein 75 second beta-propeller domain-containing protein n=1 Tax=Kwoniella dejecticola CBS 10117 TaxID=1296121 RepID=A0A1A6A7W7_9TREE|nr:uncharacterized protein I303_03870 [Kwoniella dejecticola CBS 10117]OBR86150.1 hypothetical protein I303_03870 [Kwoniella dejecticola CBS 10117]